MDGWMPAAIVVVALAVVAVRRVLGEPLNARDLWVPPVVLTCIGMWIVLHTPGLRPADHAWLAGSVLAGVALGFLRGGAVVVYARSGFLWQRYSAATFAAMVATFAAMAVLTVIAGKLGMRPEIRPVQLGLGASFLGESIAVTRRARSLSVPFAPARTGR